MNVREIENGCWLLLPDRENGERQNRYLLDGGDCGILLGGPPAAEAETWAGTIPRLLSDKPLRYAAFFGTQ